MSDKETVFHLPGFGDSELQEPIDSVTIEYTDADDGYKYVSCINLRDPIKLDSYKVLDLFKFLVEALCRRFNSEGSEEILNFFTGEWVIKSAIPKTRE